MDRLEAMRTFVAVAKLGGFAEAARQLRRSPSVVTRAIAQLEDELGLTLLLRTTRSLRLTEGGEVYLDNCQQILADVDSAERRARGEDAEPRGQVEGRGSNRVRPAACPAGDKIVIADLSQPYRSD